MQHGYYRMPTVHGDRVVFVSEDDLWEVSLSGGPARRLTANLGEVSGPRFSPDGRQLAFVGLEEGHPEVYVMPAEGGPARRLTWLGAQCMVAGWRGREILFATNARQPMGKHFELFAVDPRTGRIRPLKLGRAHHIDFGKRGVVLGRNTADPARWKRYRGGTAGHLWIDRAGRGNFERLLPGLAANITCPMWIGDRVYFLSDHEGIGNLCSCSPAGEDLAVHTRHRDFYARNASSDGETIVYHAGADLHAFSIADGKGRRINVEYGSPQVQRNRRFVDATRFLEEAALSPDGGRLALVCRGQALTLGNWDGPVHGLGGSDGARRRLARWLPDGKRVVVVSDAGGEDQLEVHDTTGRLAPKKVKNLNLGRPVRIKASPRRDEVVIANHRNQLLWVDLKTGRMKKLDESRFHFIEDFNWSPDGKWVVYAYMTTSRQSVIRIVDTRSGRKHDATAPVRLDAAPVFDPSGRYIHFLSARVYDPMPDQLQFDWSFPAGTRPYLITLRKDVPSPLLPAPRPLIAPPGDEKKGKKKADEAVKIDFDGIADRVIALPVEQGIYTGLAASAERVFYTLEPLEGRLARPLFATESEGRETLKVFDLEKREEATLLEKVSGFSTTADGCVLAVRVGKRLRVLESKKDAKQLGNDGKATRETGWVDLGRVRVSVSPPEEWAQMLREAWRLQRDYFWTADMSGVDWKKVLARYQPLVERAGTRREFSDLMWEMQGELGTSHAYELGGDYRPSPGWRQGQLGAEFEYDARQKTWRIARIARGDTWDKDAPPPLLAPGVNLSEGMRVLAVEGEPLGPGQPPESRLVHRAGQEVCLTVADRAGRNKRGVTVKALGSDAMLWYRDWVEANRAFVHEKSKGRCGYVHIPNMQVWGWSEFHRYFLVEQDHEGLLIDLRYNGGGSVSQLLLSKLARKRIGYDVTRWMSHGPYPGDSPRGPMVALTNEIAGSDGDIFSHCFKLMGLGKLVGRRTWGGVVGIWPRNWLVDGTITSQPEFSFWFEDVGWGVENYGTDPDIDVENRPQDAARGFDRQLLRALEVLLDEVRHNPPEEPDFSGRPNLALPE